MDLEDLIKFIVFAVWGIGWVLSKVRKASRAGTQPSQPRTARRARPSLPRPGRPTPAAPPPPPSPLLPAELDRLRHNAQALLESMEPMLQERLGDAVRASLLAPTEQLGSEQETWDHLSRARQLLAGYGALVELRGDPSRRELNAVADAFVEASYLPLESYLRVKGLELAAPPPLAVVAAGERVDRLQGMPLGARLLFVSPRTGTEPWRWAGLAQTMGGYVIDAVPGLVEQVFRGLDLDSQREAGEEAESWARAFFGAWWGAILADACGALLLGPSYLAAVAASSASPGLAVRVTTLRVDPQGNVQPQPPPHVRVHLIAHWLRQMGGESRAAQRVREWDESHGFPSELQLAGGYTAGVLPLAPLLSRLEALQETLFGLRLADPLGVSLSELPGLEGWSAREPQLAAAMAGLASGEPPRAEPRVQLAAAIECSLADPESAARVTRGLSQAVEAWLAEPALPALIAGESRARPRHAGPGRQVPAARRFAEALVLGELFWERPRAVGGASWLRR